MLELRRFTKHFSGIAAVDDVSFSARPGEVTGYLGPNGSGKSTTMKMNTGLIERTFDEILFAGKPIQDDLVEVIGYFRVVNARNSECSCAFPWCSSKPGQPTR
jgi:ABC-2 type transport system ATP-binding protein